MQNNEKSYRELSYWHDSLPGTLSARPALENDIDVDVAIAGAGYTGLWTAYYLKQHNPALSIAIIESEIAGFGASGRNGGWCASYLTGIEKVLAQPALAEGAKRLQEQVFDAVKEVGRITSRESVDCHFDQSGHIEAAILPAHLKKTHEYVDFMHSRGFNDGDYRWLTAQQLRDHVNIDGALGGMYMSHCAAVHPARLARGLAEVLEQKGVKIYEQTAVTKLDRRGLATSGGRVNAGVTLLATEGYTRSIKGLGRKLIPIHSMMIATEPLSELQLEQTGLSRRYLFSNADHITTYGQLTADGRIAFGCRGTYRYGSRVIDHFDPRDTEFELVWKTLLKLFPALSSSRYTHAWGGAMGVSRTLNPAVCYNRKNRIGWAGGFFGNGVGASNLAGRVLADLVLKRDTDRVHTPWVNPQRELELDKKLWETEPVRWLGIKSRARLMHMADRAERNDSSKAPLINKILETFFP